jgi:hypothetical protein
MNSKVIVKSATEGCLRIGLARPQVPNPVNNPQPSVFPDLEPVAPGVQLDEQSAGSDGAQTQRKREAAYAILRQRLLLQLLDSGCDHASHSLIIQEAATAACVASATCFRLGDIRAWVDAGTLIGWLEEEVADLFSNPTTLEPFCDGYEVESTKSMLRLLAYAYATEVLDSAEISRNCETQTAFRLLCGGSNPAPSELASLRRQHRNLIVIILVNLFHRAFSKSCCRWRAPIPLVHLSQLRECVIQRIDIARHLDAQDD